MKSANINIVSPSDVEIVQPIVAEVVSVPASTKRSWLFELFEFSFRWVRHLFGAISIVFFVAVAANIPILQFLSFGYLLEASGRIARGGKISDGMVGICKAFRIGGIVLGTWLLLIPIRFFSDSFWYEAHLIDPNSPQTSLMRMIQVLLIVLTLMQILAAWICGGKLRYFFWQLFAPFSFCVWALRRLLGSRITRPALSFSLNWISPNLTNDICNAKPVEDWFCTCHPLETVSLRFHLSEYPRWTLELCCRVEFCGIIFKLGFIGFIGTAVWLAVPTALLIGATRLQGPGAAACSVFGVIVAIPIFAILLFVQTHYAAHQRDYPVSGSRCSC